jgi:hypothetical protein
MSDEPIPDGSHAVAGSPVIASKNDVLAFLTDAMNGLTAPTDEQLSAANMLLGYYKTVKVGVEGVKKKSLAAEFGKK